MLQDVFSSHDQLTIDDITSPLSAQIFDFCDPELFQETYNQTPEVTSASNVLEKSGSFQDNHSGTSNTTENSNDNDNFNNIKLQADKDDDNTDLSIIFDSHEEYFETDIAASIDFSPSSLQYPIIDQDQYDFSSGVQAVYQPPSILSSGDPLAHPPLQLGFFEENYISSLPSYNLGLNPSSPSGSFFRNSGLPAYMANMSMGLPSSESGSGISHGSIHLGSEFNKPHDEMVKFQVENGSLFSTDSIEHIFNPDDLKELGDVENQANSVLGPVEIAGLEENKVGKLSAEERKEKINRYMKKRNERNFSKKIKYACRKTLADSRPRVRGRFAKNDEFCEPSKHASSNHQDMGVKDEEQLVDTSDIFAQISGANSYKFNYPIQSWI